MQQDDRIFAVVGTCVVLAVALGAALMWVGSGITVDAPTRATVVVPPNPPPTPLASPIAQSEIVEANFPSDLDDRLVRAAVEGLSSHPEFAAYLVNDRLLRRFVAVVDAIAGGYSPRNEIEFMRPIRPFLVREDEGRLVISSGSFHRYDLAAEVFASFDIESALTLYDRFRPQLEAIYQETGWASESFDSRLREAVDHLLEYGVESGQFEVEQRAIVYAFAEDHLERLSSAQKQLVRMGSNNARLVQNKLREFRDAFGWPEPAPGIVTAELEQEVAPVAPAEVIADATPLLPIDIFERIEAAEMP
jgi:hypothetical protein